MKINCLSRPFSTLWNSSGLLIVRIFPNSYSYLRPFHERYYTWNTIFNRFVSNFWLLLTCWLRFPWRIIEIIFLNFFSPTFFCDIFLQLIEFLFVYLFFLGFQLPYSINIESSDLDVLPRPTMNISRVGNVPTEIETFSIDMQCSGLRSAEVEVTIKIEVTLNRATNNVTELVFRRKKICLHV